ncbi:MAG TPA: DUF4282 domain-containing protein [Candidatus Goldiibacteriota bacterium]|nr:DUF4282 domain-containing protein [Candidatus Goldiibacteriota bacterium]
MAKVTATEVKEGAKTFLGSLFDFSFSDFITTKLIKFLFGAGIVLGAIFGVISIIGAFMQAATAGIISLIVTPIVYFLGIIILRIWLELVIILFKIEENTR